MPTCARPRWRRLAVRYSHRLVANYGFAIDLRKCIGCHACTIACKAEHDIPVGVNRCWVKTVEKGTFPDTRRFFFPVLCNQCVDAPCARICPTSCLEMNVVPSRSEGFGPTMPGSPTPSLRVASAA